MHVWSLASNLPPTLPWPPIAPQGRDAAQWRNADCLRCSEPLAFAQEDITTVRKPPVPCAGIFKEDLLDENWRVRKLAAANLGKRGALAGDLDHEMTSDLLQDALLTDSHWEVRREAAWALQGLGREAVETSAKSLRKALGDGDNLVSAAALQALRRHGQAVPAPVWHPSFFEKELRPPPLMGAASDSWLPLEEEDEDADDSSNQIWSLNRRRTLSKLLSEDAAESSSQVLVGDDLPPLQEIVVLLQRRSPCQSWGLFVEHMRGVELKIKALGLGMVDDWNTTHPSKKVEVGDVIKKINETSGDASAIMQVLRSSRSLHMVIQKGSADSSVRAVSVQSRAQTVSLAVAPVMLDLMTMEPEATDLPVEREDGCGERR